MFISLQRSYLFSFSPSCSSIYLSWSISTLHPPCDSLLFDPIITFSLPFLLLPPASASRQPGARSSADDRNDTARAWEVALCEGATL